MAMIFRMKPSTLRRTKLSPLFSHSIFPRASPSSHRAITTHPNPHPLNPINLDRTTLTPERAETTFSATDNTAGDDISSYDPSTTTPESELVSFAAEMRVEGEGDPLFISPANRDFSRLIDRDADARAVVQGRGRAWGSGRGWVNKRGVVTVRTKGGGWERLMRGLRRVQRERLVIYLFLVVLVGMWTYANVRRDEAARARAKEAAAGAGGAATDDKGA